MSQKKKDSTSGQKKTVAAKKDLPQLGQTSLSSWFTSRPPTASQIVTPSPAISDSTAKVSTRSASLSPVVSPVESPKKKSSKAKELVLSHTLDKDVKEVKEKKKVKEEKKDKVKTEKKEKVKKSPSSKSSSRSNSTVSSPKTTPVSSPEKSKKKAKKFVISDSSDEVDDIVHINSEGEEIVKFEAAPSFKRQRQDSVISILNSQEPESTTSISSTTSSKKSTKSSTPSSNKKAKTENGAKKTSGTKGKKESVKKESVQSMTIDDNGENIELDDAIDPKHPHLKPLTSFKIGMQKGAPPNQGSKIIPEGKPDCLKGMSFIITGTLDSLEREEATKLIEAHGGLVFVTVTKKVTHVLLGDQYGGAKMKKILKMNLKTYDEDELLDIIRKSKPQDPNRTLPVLKQINHVVVPKEGTSHYLWADKYKPERIDDLVGNNGLIMKVKSWLENWNTCLESEKVKRAVLITGPPGIGKTTTAMILAKELGYEAIVTNASDTRNVSSLQELLKTNDNKSIASFMSFTKNPVPETPKKLLYIMDEIDGMSSGDKGGVAELCKIIPKTKTPFICIANDRFSKKLTSLIKYCMDVQFVSPSMNQILARVSVITKAENYNISQPNLQKVIESTHGDFRQVLNLLQMWSYSEVENNSHGNNQNNNNNKVTKESLDLATKDFTLCAEDTIPMFFSRAESLPKKFDAWFVDYTFTPTIIQDRYLSGIPSNNIEAASRAADSISDGDLISESIFRKQDFELLPIHGLMSAIIPGHHAYMGGKKFSYFPIWFSKSKSEQSHRDQLFTIQKNTNNNLFSDPESIGMEYTHLLSHYLTTPLIKEGKEGCDEVIQFMDEYGLTIEDRDSILEYEKAFGKDLIAQIPAATKAAFTRAFNADHWTVKENKSTKKGDKKGDKASPKSTTVKKNEYVELDINDMKAKPKKKAAAPKKPKK